MCKDDFVKTLKDENEPYEYQCIFTFGSMISETDGFGEVQMIKKVEPLLINLIAFGRCPRIKISKWILNFGDCPVNDHRDIAVSIENKNEEFTIDYRFHKIAHFSASPKYCKLKPS